MHILEGDQGGEEDEVIPGSRGESQDMTSGDMMDSGSSSSSSSSRKKKDKKKKKEEGRGKGNYNFISSCKLILSFFCSHHTSQLFYQQYENMM